MNNNIKSGLFKLSKDVTFKITLIVGAVLAILLNLIYLLLDLAEGEIGMTCNGQSMFISSLSPTQNFGLTVPVNLIIFTIGEFNCGTIRNKIIAGHKRSEIYLSLLLIGGIFTISLMTIYFGLSVGIASIIGGFDPSGPGLLSTFRPEYLYQYSLMALATYLFITAFAVFVSVSLRNIGGALPIVIISIMLLYFISFIPSLINSIEHMRDGELPLAIQAYINPLYTFGTFGLIYPKISNEWFVVSLVTPIAWSILLSALGILIFNKTDIK